MPQRFYLTSPLGKHVERGDSLLLHNQPWNIIGWDDRKCFVLVERDGAACELPQQMCFDLGYRWRPLISTGSRVPKGKQRGKQWRGGKRILKPRITLS